MTCPSYADGFLAEHLDTESNRFARIRFGQVGGMTVVPDDDFGSQPKSFLCHR